jgi:CRISPR/Cas system-associated endoribonuclease Cas2
MKGPFIVSYDLRQPGRNYAALAAVLVALGAVRVLESVWVLPSSPHSAQAIHTLLAQHIDYNDQLLVARLSGEAAWSNSIAAPLTTWLHQNLG